MTLSDPDYQHRGARDDREAILTASVDIVSKAPADDGDRFELGF
jgi:hypothetical protein